MKRKNAGEIKNQAFALRRNGRSFSEIGGLLKVSKATLSAWFKGVQFSKDEQLLITQNGRLKRRLGVQKSVLTNRMRVALSEQKNASLANKEFDTFKKHHLFITGLTLYWAQGAQNNAGFHYANSDPEKVRLMIAFATNFLGITKHELSFRLFAPALANNEGILTYWAGVLGVKEGSFKPTIVQKVGKNTVQKSQNTAKNKGSMRISYNSATLLRKILVWQKRLVRYYQET